MVSQLIVKDSVASDEFELNVVENPLNQPSIAFEDKAHGQHIPRLGSQDLIRIASDAVRHGWELERFEIVDVTHSYLDEEREWEVSTALSSMIVSEGVAAALVTLIDRFPSFSVSGVELVDPQDRAVILRRGGVIVADEGADPLEFLRLLWRRLRLT
jgi:hypothetical protein